MEPKKVGVRVKTVVEEILPQQPGQPSFGVKETNNINPVEVKETKRTFVKFFLIAFGITVIVLLLVGGVWVYMNGSKNQKLDSSSITIISTPTPVATQIPVESSPSPAPRALSDYKISVLNGSGKIGAATTAKNLLTKAGFKVASMGNAENFNFETTLIQTKSEVGADTIAKIKDSLSSSYSAQIGKALDEAGQFDVIIIVGLQ